MLAFQRATEREASQWLRLFRQPQFKPRDIDSMTLGDLYKKAGLMNPELFPIKADLTQGD